jgi:hypothetical protein
VRRLLADAGGPVPTPPDVVARLDATLARLVAERDAEERSEGPAEGSAESAPGPATVTPLAVRRRRWPKLLLAAAAVAVGGYGVGAALTGSMSGEDASSSAGGSGVAEDRAEAGGSASSGGADSSAGGSGKGMLEASGRVLRLSSADFDAEVARLARRAPTASAQDGSVDKTRSHARRRPRAQRHRPGAGLQLRRHHARAGQHRRPELTPTGAADGVARECPGT